VTGAQTFGDRVRDAVAASGPLCVGIDPHEHLLAEWGLGFSADGVREFGLRVVDAAAGRAGIVKPQVSFFERHGAAGLAALELVLAAARGAGLIVIADAKRGDIGTTMDAYAQAWLTPGSPLEADALTVNPFLGVGTLAHTFDLAESTGKGVFVLVATSNPDGFPTQRALLPDGRTVSAGVLDEVSERNAQTVADGSWGSLGFVIGATVDWPAAGLGALTTPAPILAPGFGHQGATPAELTSRFGRSAPFVLASESRSILSAGPSGLAEAIDARVREYRSLDV
jgi:orotidine-5'-phosphate decarboxylase